MAAELALVLRARSLRAQLAHTESLRLRQAVAAARAAADVQRSRKAAHEAQAARAGERMHAAAIGNAPPLFADEVQRLLAFAAGARLKASEGVALVRRAELVRQRAQEASDAANDTARGLALRHARVAQVAGQRDVKAQRRRVERDDETAAESHTTRVVALRADRSAPTDDEPDHV